MKIVMTGGGSGGHITPILVVTRELKLRRPDAEIIYIGYQGDPLGDIPTHDENIDQTYFVRAGKLRRYHGEGARQLFDIPTVLNNIRDIFFVIAGIWQCFWLLRKLKPDVIFIKGGFVGMPVGLVAAVLRIPYITHDSDALPGLANRVISPWARLHTVALPKEVYNYPPDKTVTVGVPHATEFHLLKDADVINMRKQLDLDKFKRIVLVTGGGLGAQRLNNAMLACIPALLSRYSDLAVVHITGRKDEPDIRQQYKTGLVAKDQGRVITRGFVTNLYQYSGAADVIITRAGATAISEFAAQAKPCIVVPSPFLAGGHQLKNAKVLAAGKAVRMVNESDLVTDPLVLMAPLVDLLDHPLQAQQLGKRLGLMASPDAASRLAMLLLKIAGE